MRTFVISDLHGRLDVLEAALERVEQYQSGGTVVFTGDYVDRGPWSKGVMDRLMAGPTVPGWKWVCLKGNHEDMMVGVADCTDEPSTWLGNGGVQTLASFGGEIPEKYIEWARNLLVYHTDGKRIFVHAGVNPSASIGEQAEATLLWFRCGKNADYSHTDGYIVHGHTPFEDGPIVLPGRANLDTGACWTGRLCIAVFDDDKAGGPVELLTVQCPPLSQLQAAA